MAANTGKRITDPNDPNYDPNADPNAPQPVGPDAVITNTPAAPAPTGGSLTTQPVGSPLTRGDDPPGGPLLPDAPPQEVPAVQTTPAFQPPAPLPLGASIPDPFASMGGGVQIPGGGWVPQGHPLAAGGTASSTTQSSSSSGNMQPPDIASAERAALLQLLKTPQTLSPEDIANNPASQAYHLQGQRADEAARRDLAERASAEGYSDSGAVDAELNKIREARGVSEQGFVGNLAVNQLRDNRDALMQSIQLAESMGQFDKSQALQRELAATDSALRNKGLDVQQTTANNNLGYNYTALQLDANRQALLALMNGGASA